LIAVESSCCLVELVPAPAYNQRLERHSPGLIGCNLERDLEVLLRDRVSVALTGEHQRRGRDVYDAQLDVEGCSHSRRCDGPRDRSPESHPQYDLAYLMNRPKKSLPPGVLVFHDCLLRARNLCSVNPIVRLTRDSFVEVFSASLMAAAVCSFLIAAASAFCLVLPPNRVC